VKRQKRPQEKRVTGSGVLNTLRKRGGRLLGGYSKDDANAGHRPVIMSGSLPGFGGSGGQGREPGARRRKLAGYLKAANELRQSYQQSYSEKWGANNTDEHWESRSIPGEFPDAGIVAHGDEHLVLFPSYAKRHFKKPPEPNSSRNTDRYEEAESDPDYWAREWQKYEDDRAIVDVDVRGWLYSPHRGPLTRKNRLLIGIARQLSGIPAPPRGSGIASRESSPGMAASLQARHEEHEAQREQERIAREAEQILRRGQGEERVAERGGYSEQPKPDDGVGRTNSGSPSRSGSSTPKSYGEPEGPGHLQKKVSWNQPSDMSQEELIAANSNLMARLLPFLTNPLVAAPITVFFYNDDSSVSRSVATDDSGHFNLRAALDFVPTHVRILASEHLSITEKVRIIEPMGVSIISDVDDTIKHTSISSGAREIFRNAFVRDLSDLTIDGVKKWYCKMYDMGVDIHYVSNSPWQLFPVLVSYFRQAGLPPGSYHLKQYSGMLQGIFEPVAERKKGTLEKIMRDFPERKFILIGDSGEADLEVYTDVVMANPGRVIAVLIRDVTTPYPSQGFFDSAMGPLSLDRRSGRTQFATGSPARYGSIASSRTSPSPGPAPPPLPRRPASDAAIEKNEEHETVKKLIDFDQGSEPASTNKSNHLDDMKGLEQPSNTSVGNQNRRAPPPRPAKPSSLRAASMPEISDSSPAPEAKSRVPPPPPKPRRVSSRQELKPTVQRGGQSNSDLSNEGYLSYAKDKVSEAYNALPEIRSHIYSNTERPSSASPQPSEPPKTKSDKPPPPPPRRGTAASIASMTATVTSHLPNMATSGADSNESYSYSNSDPSAPLNKKLELWKRRWQHAKRILDDKGVALRSWRVGDDVSSETIKMIEDAMRKMGSGSQGQKKK
ncbi:hypothetical protein F5884DRAFT_667905, partial [Xylogone sp. PMI_703]